MYRSALGHRDLRLLLMGLLVSATGSWAYNVALLAVVYDRTESLGWVSAAGVLRFLPLLVFSPYAGVLADRFERVRVMVGSDLVAAATQGALAVVAVADGPVVLVIALAALTATATTPYEPAVAAMIPQVVGEDDLAAANAARGLLENIVQVVGPATGAALLLVAPAWVVFAVNAGTFAASAALVVRMRARSRPVDVTEGGSAGPLAQLAVGMREIAHSRSVFLLVMLSVLASFVYGCDTVLFVGAADQRLGLGPDGFGVLLTGLAVGGLAAAPAVNRLASSRRLAAVLTGAMVVYCLPNVALAVTDSPAVAFGAQVVRGAGTLIVDVVAMTALQRAVAPEVTARVFGVFWALIIGAIALGALLASPVVALLGLEGAIVALAVVPVLLALAAYPLLARTDRETAARTAQLAHRIAVLEPVGIFAGAPRPVLERLAADSTAFNVSGGAVVIREGDPADALYVVRSGTVDVVAGERTVATLGPGGWFGELGLLEGIPRTATVVAAERCALLRIEGAAFLDALTTAPLASSALEGARARFRSVRGHDPTFGGPT